MKKDRVSIVIPIYNETLGVYSLVRKTRTLSINKEIIIIDDGSTFTKTITILNKIKRNFPDIRIIKNRKNIGKASSVIKGLQKAKGNIFVILDGDSELDPLDIVKMYKTLKQKKVCIVNGTRVVRNKKLLKSKTNILTRLTKKGISLLINVLYNRRINDVLSGYKMFYTNDAKELSIQSKRFGFETEFLVRSLKKRKTIAQVDISYFPRTFKQGKKINILDGLEILHVLWVNSPIYRIIAGSSRLHLAVTAFAIFTIAFLSFTYSMQYFPTTDSLPNNFTALNIIYNNRVDLSNLEKLIEDNGVIQTTVVNKQGRRFSKTPPIIGIITAPLFKIVNAYYGVRHLTLEEIVSNEYSQFAGKLIASFFTAVASALLFLILSNVFKKEVFMNVSLSLVFIFATGAFNIASQANWQHGISLFFILSFLYILLTRHKSLIWLFVLGLIAGVFTHIRISNGFYLLSPVIFLLLINKSGGKAAKYMGTYLFSALATYFVIYGYYKYLGVPSGYIGEILFSIKEWTPQVFTKNLIAILFSYNNGLFFANPILLLSIPSIILLLRKKRRSSANFFLLSLVPTLIIYIIFASSWWMWTGGRANNARMLTETIPILVIFIGIVYKNYRRSIVFYGVFFVLVYFSVLTNVLTTYYSDFTWFGKYLHSGHRSQVRNAWYRKPTYYQYILDQKTRFHVDFFREKNRLIKRKRVFEFDKDGEEFIKISDVEFTVLDI